MLEKEESRYYCTVMYLYWWHHFLLQLSEVYSLLDADMCSYNANSISTSSVKKQDSAWPLPSEFDFGPHV